jgi:site-specific DNA-methyltransferase (adenine-specific)
VETNALYFGDNLKVLSERNPDDTFRFPSESVDLIYLDPPFNSNRNYNLIFKERGGEQADAQIRAFEDTWTWDNKARDMLRWLTVEGVNEGRIPDDVGRLIDSLVRGVRHSDMGAYLVMMTPRMVELHRVLKRTGSLYLHCDPTASSYLRVLLDGIFGPERFMAELVWKRTTTHSDAKRWSPDADHLLVYTKSDEFTFHPAFEPHSAKYLAHDYRHREADGRVYRLDNIASPNPRRNLMYEWKGHKPPAKGWRFSPETMARLDAEARIWYPDSKEKRPKVKRYLAEMPGTRVGSVWSDLPNVHPWSNERLGYPTQKPLALLERIIAASSNEGDVVLDPFCGCGTALIAAEKLKRRWVGIDITHLSIAVMRARLMDSFGLADVPVHGVPADLESARMLAAESKDGRYEFQWWALEKIAATPLGGERKKGADRGIDGVITFTERDAIQRILVSVKSGHPSLAHVKELIATLQTEKGAIGILIELDEPTSEMKRAALEAGQYESELWGGQYARLQILTVAELLAGKKPSIPKFLPGYQKAMRIAAEQGEQQGLWELPGG